MYIGWVPHKLNDRNEIFPMNCNGFNVTCVITFCLLDPQSRLFLAKQFQMTEHRQIINLTKTYVTYHNIFVRSQKTNLHKNPVSKVSFQSPGRDLSSHLSRGRGAAPPCCQSRWTWRPWLRRSGSPPGQCSWCRSDESQNSPQKAIHPSDCEKQSWNTTSLKRFA